MQFEEVLFNDHPLYLPHYTLETMVHCTHKVGHDPRKHIYLECRHSKVMEKWLSIGEATFIDIGAATGAMTLPFSLKFPKVQVIAFEPNHHVRQILIETLIKNNCLTPLVLDTALSAAAGVESFTALDLDKSGQTPYLPEASSLSKLENDYEKEYYEVRVSTLDLIMQQMQVNENVIIKIDVEGWEAKVLEGGLNFIKHTKPYFSIDIHRDPFGEGETEPSVQDLLRPLGYEFERIDHVLLCQPM